MSRFFVVFVVVLLTMTMVPATSAQQRGTGPRTAAPTYAQLVITGHDYFKEGKTKQAYAAAMMAAQMDPARSEAYALAAAVMHVQGAASEARYFIDQALARADATQLPKLRQLASEIESARVSRGRGAPATGNRAAGGRSSSAPAAPATIAGTKWAGPLKGAYNYERSASKPLEATLSMTFLPAGTGTAAYNSSPQAVSWSQNGRYLAVEASLRDYGCPAKLTIRATVDGGTLNGVFNISGAGCAAASGTWVARPSM